MTLKIECPECQQAFEVDPELEGRTVECGSCENRFQVTQGVMVTQRERFYPDESRKGTDMSRFGRATSEAPPVAFQTMEYKDTPTSQTFTGPVPPVRAFCAWGGLLILLTVAALFYYSSRPGVSILRDVEQLERLTLAGFFGLVGFALHVWGMFKHRILGVIIGVVGAGGLFYLAYTLPISRTLTFDSDTVASSSEPEETEESAFDEVPAYFPGISGEEDLTTEELISETRWKAEVLPLIAKGDEKDVAAIWVRSMDEFHKSQIRNYLSQEFDLAVRPDFRKLRDGGLFVLSGSPFDLDQVEVVVGRFGEVERVIPDLRLIQMQVNSEVMGEVSNELTNKLNDSEGGAFYSLNFRELIALDQSRMKDAVKRLSLAEPIQMRKDITVRLVSLLGQEQDLETCGNIAAALQVWSEEGDGADQVLVDLVGEMRGRGSAIPDEVLRFLSERKTPSAGLLMVELWSENPVGRQRFLELYGSQAARFLPPYLRSTKSGLSLSAAQMLGKIGTKKELTPMRETLSGSVSGELKRLLEEAIERINRR